MAFPHPIQPKMFEEQRHRLGVSLAADYPDGHAALVQAGAEIPINSTDMNYLFHQESYYYYLFGLDMPEVYGAVLADGRGIIFIPQLPEDFATWMGPLPTPEAIQQKTGVDEVHYVQNMEKVLTAYGVHTVQVLKGVNSDSSLPVKTAALPSHCGKLKTCEDWLFNALSEQRVFKTALEAEVLKYVCKVSSMAHIKVMQMCKPGLSQHQLESTFLHEVYYNGGCRKVSYTCICATGHHGGILHYPDNDQPIEDGTMALLDMGGEYQCYASDITCSFPVNGKFTEKQKTIYCAVLDAHNRVIKAMKPGVSWVAMHRLALRTMCEHLVKAGILLGEVDALMEKQIMQYFQPHGLGHLVGLDVHDVGAYLDNYPPRPTEKDCCNLRTARELAPNIYITVEPGCYFNHALLNKALGDPAVKSCLNEAMIKEYWNFGGVRIESDVMVTADGVVNFTCVPRTVEEVESTMSGHPFSMEVQVFHN